MDPIFRTADVVGDAWSWLVMREALLYRVSRFDHFQNRLGVARSTLTRRLTQLTAGGLLSRDTGPDYLPTEAGRDFIGCLLVAKRWGDQWCFAPSETPQPAIHVSCGHQLIAVLQCGACHERLTARAVTAQQRSPQVRPAQQGGGRKGRSPDLELLERTRICSITRALTVAGDLWGSLIIRECFFGTRRFDDFQRRLDIAPNILSARLRRLVQLDMLTKVQYETWPIRHEYRLTERGLDYYHVPLAMHTWGVRWLGATASDPQLSHKPCGSDLQPDLACASCLQGITGADIALT